MEENKLKPTRNEKKKAKRDKKINTILGYSTENDIKYRGPLGVRSLRIIGWIFMILSAITISLYIVLFTQSVDPEDPKIMVSLMICMYCGKLSVPCFMLAKFGMVFQRKRNIKNMLITFGGFALIVAVLYLLAYFHYGIRLIETIRNVGYIEARNELEAFLHTLSSKKLGFNVFLDMLLWGSYFAIIEYQIKNKNTLKIMLQRVLSSLPLLYVIVWFILKIFFALGKINIDGALLPFIPSTTPVIFLTFIVVSLFLNKRKKLYLKIGGTEEKYENYLKTNANSLHFSKLTALAFLLAGIIDLVLMLIIQGTTAPEIAKSILGTTGMGGCIAYIAFAPIIVLFSYTREYKGDKIDLVINIIAIIIMALIVFEGFFYTLIHWISYVFSIFS